jgi:hypothetical protein
MNSAARSAVVVVCALLAQTFHLHAQLSATDSIIRFWMAPQTVNSTRPVFNTFYFWASIQEIDSVLNQQRLLRTSETAGMLEARYLDELFYSGQKNPDDGMCAHLRTGDRVRVRAAWPNYWSTLTEGGSESHDQLVQVVLMDSALIVSFDTEANGKKRWTIFDLRGNEIVMDDAIKRKDHIAVVFVQGKYKAVMQAGPRRLVQQEYYRTFILCNERMIKSWHHAVPGMQQKILNDLDYLLLLHGYFSEGWTMGEPGKRGKLARAAWKKSAAQLKALDEFFFATQRFAWTDGPRADASSTKVIIDRLRSRWPLQKNMVERFPGR